MPPKIRRVFQFLKDTILIAVNRSSSVNVNYVPVISTGRCNAGFRFLCWGLVLQGLSRALVELPGGCAEFGLAEARCINAFGEVLPEATVGIFVAASLPRRLGIAKIDVDLRGNGELAMPCHF